MAPKKNDFFALFFGICFGLLFLLFVLAPPALASSLDADPFDASTSSPEYELQSGEFSEPPPEDVSDAQSEAETDDFSSVSSDESSSDASGPDVIVTPIESDPVPGVYNPSEDVVVDRADLQQVIDLLNDLSTQLVLYASEIPVGYEPTEEDLQYRANLLVTLADISDSLQALTASPEDEAQDDAPGDASVSEPDASAPAESPAPAETDPADNGTESLNASAESSLPVDTIAEQDFYKLVLALLLALVLLPVLGWVYKFISSFFPV